MNCRACGRPIPSQLLRRDSFQCPNCGRSYHRNPQSSGAPVAAEKRSARKSKPPREPVRLPKWLLPAVAGILVLALIAGGVFLLSKKGFGAAGVSGTVMLEKLASKDNSVTTIEIPSQGGTDYMIVTESSQIGIICSIKEKTPTSFDLVVRNVHSKDRNPTINWALIPIKPSN